MKMVENSVSSKVHDTSNQISDRSNRSGPTLRKSARGHTNEEISNKNNNNNPFKKKY